MTEFDIRSVLTVEPDEISALYALWFIKTCQGFHNIYEAQGDTIVEDRPSYSIACWMK